MRDIVLTALALGFVYWLMKPLPASHLTSVDSAAEPESPPSEGMSVAEIGVAVGAMGGSIADAAVVNYALERAQAESGQPPKAFEVGVAIGLQKSIGL